MTIRCQAQSGGDTGGQKERKGGDSSLYILGSLRFSIQEIVHISICRLGIYQMKHLLKWVRIDEINTHIYVCACPT